MPLLLAGCARAVNPYAKWYETFPERAPTDSAVSAQEVWILVGQNPRAEVPILLRNGYAETFDYRKFVESRRGRPTSFLLDRDGIAVQKVVIARP
jgi:hypothetical protein